MKEKRNKDKHKKKSKHKDKRERKRRSSTSSSSSSEDEWVEKQPVPKQSTAEREDWMAMTGMMKTYTKDDIRKPKQEEKKHIDSYNPATSSRELNPYWKDGGGGLPQTADSFRKSRQFLKPEASGDLYSRSSSSKDSSDRDHKSSSSKSSYSYGSYSQRTSSWRKESKSDDHRKSKEDSRSKSREDSRRDSRDDCRSDSRDKRDDYKSESRDRRDDYKDPRDRRDHYNNSRASNDYKDSKDSRDDYRREIKESKRRDSSDESPEIIRHTELKTSTTQKPVETKHDSNTPYLSDEKMNKLAAKIVKAEIMGNSTLVAELKAKLEAAREYKKENPDAGKEEDDRVMLTSTNSMGNSRPLTKGVGGDPRSKGGKRKAETHASGERMKYFGNDDKYNLKQMFEEEKYGNNYNEEEELAKIAAKHKNPNDDLEDIFTDEISKNRNEAKDSEREKQRAIKMHNKMERTLEGCEYCVDSKNMLKHLMVSCGTKVYLALPARKSMVKGECIITTIQHSTCVTAIDEDVWEEITHYRQALTKFFNGQDKDIVFFETATRLHKLPHMVIHCVPLPRDVGDMASIYFKKALLECEAEWSVNKKVVELKGKNIRKGVPKGLPYFWVDFGMDPGFAHVIEDQQLFPRNFAEEIIGGILDLDHYLWKNPRREPGDEQRQKVLEFSREWKPFDIVNKNKD